MARRETTFVLTVQRRREYWARLGSRVTHFRLRARLTQEQLGDRIGVKQHYISALERGKVLGLAVHYVRPLAKALGVSVEELV